MNHVHAVSPEAECVHLCSKSLFILILLALACIFWMPLKHRLFFSFNLRKQGRRLWAHIFLRFCGLYQTWMSSTDINISRFLWRFHSEHCGWQFYHTLRSNLYTLHSMSNHLPQVSDLKRWPAPAEGMNYKSSHWWTHASETDPH